MLQQDETDGLYKFYLGLNNITLPFCDMLSGRSSIKAIEGFFRKNLKNSNVRCPLKVILIPAFTTKERTHFLFILIGSCVWSRHSTRRLRFAFSNASW